jgi:hypothetical protein
VAAVKGMMKMGYSFIKRDKGINRMYNDLKKMRRDLEKMSKNLESLRKWTK